ncbi:6-phosphogluconate dehydrogenase [Cryomyces antarcticus]
MANRPFRILSIGEMGLGIAKLLAAHNYRVITNLSDRSEATRERALSADLSLVRTDADLTRQADYILSIVPPRDALATAQRIVSAFTPERSRDKTSPLYYLDLNAISPSSARSIASLLAPVQHWTRPSLVVSGPYDLTDAQPSGDNLVHVLNLQHIAPTIGPASGLKMCFASLTKGFTALAIQSFTTAHRLGVLGELKSQLKVHSPKSGELAERSLVGMPPKAYRWVREMEEIGNTFREDGGFDMVDDEMLKGAAEVYALIADETDLGLEKTKKRVRGTTAEDVARCTSEGIKRRKEKTE